jgi:hypothetical protein
VLDGELQALPAGFRAPLVLCYMEGKTRDEAAQQLGWSAGTVKSRLERGREKLRRRLARRGVTLSTALLGTLLTETTGSAVPAPLAAGVVRFAMSFGFGPAAGLPPSVALLAEGVLRARWLTHLKAISLVLLLTCVTAGTGAWAYVRTATRVVTPWPDESSAQRLSGKVSSD